MIAIHPTGKALGAEIQQVNLKAISEADFEAVHQAWLDHLVLLFRGQELTDEDFIAFSRRFGDLDWAPIQETGRRFVEVIPEIYVVSNVVENGVPIGSLGAGEATSAHRYVLSGRPAQSQHAVRSGSPARRAETRGFAICIWRMSRLPDPLKQRIQCLMLKHDGTYNSGGYVRQGVTAVDDPVNSPGAYHPLVCRHPRPGGAGCIWGEGVTLT